MYDPSHTQTPAPAAPTPAGTSDEVVALRAEVAQIGPLRTEVAALKQDLAEERAARSELVYALRNKAVKTERSTAIAAACILEHKKSVDPGQALPNKGGGWHRVYLDAVAEQAGCSPQRASAHLDRLTEWYEVTRAGAEPIPTPVEIAPNPFTLALDNPNDTCLRVVTSVQARDMLRDARR